MAKTETKTEVNNKVGYEVALEGEILGIVSRLKLCRMVGWSKAIIPDTGQRKINGKQVSWRKVDSVSFTAFMNTGEKSSD